MHPYTDSIDQPITEGDYILYPVAAGSSSAHFNIGRIAEIDPLVEITEENGRKHWYYKSMAVRGQHKRGSGVYNPTTDPTKQYRLRVRRVRQRGAAPWTENKDALSTLVNVDRIVVITAIYKPRPGDNV